MFSGDENFDEAGQPIRCPECKTGITVDRNLKFKFSCCCGWMLCEACWKDLVQKGGRKVVCRQCSFSLPTESSWSDDPIEVQQLKKERMTREKMEKLERSDFDVLRCARCDKARPIPDCKDCKEIATSEYNLYLELEAEVVYTQSRPAGVGGSSKAVDQAKAELRAFLERNRKVRDSKMTSAAAGLKEAARQSDLEGKQSQPQQPQPPQALAQPAAQLHVPLGGVAPLPITDAQSKRAQEEAKAIAERLDRERSLQEALQGLSFAL